MDEVNNMFDEVKGRFGFGVMRLKQDDKGDINFDEFQKMVDYFMANGFNYFDTAHVYLNGNSERALKECLVRNYPRHTFTITNKLSPSCFNKEEDILPFFNMQLAATGVDYFDFYLMHAQQKNNYDQYNNCHAYEIAKKLKEEGKIVSLMDNDRTGYLEAIWLRDNYNIIPITIPKRLYAKDFAELASKTDINNLYVLIISAINYINKYERKNHKFTWNTEEDNTLPY